MKWHVKLLKTRSTRGTYSISFGQESQGRCTNPWPFVLGMGGRRATAHRPSIQKPNDKQAQDSHRAWLPQATACTHDERGFLCRLRVLQQPAEGALVRTCDSTVTVTVMSRRNVYVFFWSKLSEASRGLRHPFITVEMDGDTGLSSPRLLLIWFIYFPSVRLLD